MSARPNLAGPRDLARACRDEILRGKVQNLSPDDFEDLLKTDWSLGHKRFGELRMTIPMIRLRYPGSPENLVKTSVNIWKKLNIYERTFEPDFWETDVRGLTFLHYAIELVIPGLLRLILKWQPLMSSFLLLNNHSTTLLRALFRVLFRS